MLLSLSIKNYALIKELEIHFGNGLNVITGETGAGKSIIVGALGTILGERVDTTLLRNGAAKAVVEGRISIKGNDTVKRVLCANDISSDDELIVRREILENGRSRAFINDTPVQVSFLQSVCDLLFDFHGQHDHQSLLKVQNHLTFLDDFGDTGADLARVAESFHLLESLQRERAELEARQQSFREKREHYQFQINEISKIDPSPEEEDRLTAEEKIVQNGERLFKLANELYQILYEDEHSVYELLSRADSGLSELASIDSKFIDFSKEFKNARITVEELATFLQRYESNIAFNPQRLEEIQRRLSDLAGLKKRFGGSLAEILKQREALLTELEGLDTLGAQLESVEKRIVEERKVFSKLCQELSGKRKSAAQNLKTLIPEILHFLGMSNSRFMVELKYHNDPEGWASISGQNYRATATGMDVAEFLVAANKGEEMRPLAKVASGGEISRIMLALKSVVAQKDRIPILVFDEIDIGVSGRVAQSVGRKLRYLSEFHQVICITHLPQIASMGDLHFLVEKEEEGGRTETHIRKLEKEERTLAIAKLLAGERISETHLESARELLEDAATN